MTKRIQIEFDEPVSVEFFVAVSNLMTKKFGKGLLIPTEDMEIVRRAAAVLEAIGKQCKERQRA